MTGWLAQRTPLTTPLRMLALGLGLIGLVLGGCSGTQAHTYTLTMPEGVLRMGVDIENYRGHVEVIADDSARNITVDGWIWLSGETIEQGGEEPYAMTDIEARVERSPDAPGSAVLRVRTSSEHSEFLDHHVRLVVRAPRVDGLRIVNHDGFVEVVDASGAVDIENYTGGVQFRSSKPILDPVKVLGTDTNIWYLVPEGSQGEVVLETLEGRAVYKNTLTESTNTYTTSSQDGTDGSVIRTILGGGTNPVNIRTNRGDVHLVLMEDPVGHKQNFNWVMPELRNYIKFNGSRRYKRNLPDDDYRSDTE
ncbi:MAG: hypothetical protein ACIAQF_01555 [Phycisphaerales bacterium JB065]